MSKWKKILIIDLTFVVLASFFIAITQYQSSKVVPYAKGDPNHSAGNYICSNYDGLEYCTLSDLILYEGIMSLPFNMLRFLFIDKYIIINGILVIALVFLIKEDSKFNIKHEK